MVDKAGRRLVPVPVDFVAVSVPDVFVLGSGLDFAGRYRNVEGLFGADPVALAADPDLHVADLYERRG
jgi:hypoxanthine phosphoribosyltransferase